MVWNSMLEYLNCLPLSYEARGNHADQRRCCCYNHADQRCCCCYNDTTAAVAMQDSDRNKIRQNFVTFTKLVNIDHEFLSYFVQFNCLSDGNIEEILVESTMVKKFHCFHKKLIRSTEDAYEIFVFSLMKTNQKHLAKLLHDDLDSVWSQYETQSELKPPTNINGSGDHYSNQPLLQLLPKNELKEIREMGNDKVTVNKLTHESATNFIKLNSSDMYKVSQAIRGQMLLITNEYFTVANLPKRVGTLYDEMDITDLFQNLNFDVKRYKDLEAQEILLKLKEYASGIQRGKCEMFILCIMSHGDKGIVYGVDGEKVSIDDIASTFDGHNCPALRGIPRLFIIQACQGAETSKGSTVADCKTSDTTTPAPSTSTSSQTLEKTTEISATEPSLPEPNSADRQHQETNPDPMGGGSTVPDSQQSSVLVPIHEKSDEIFAFATVKNYLCWRHETEGSWYIQDLITVFAENAYKEHLADLLIMVTDRIKKRLTDQKFIQLPYFASNLSKKYYFMPGFKGI